MLDRNEMMIRGTQPSQGMAPYMPQRQFVPPPEPDEPSIFAAIWRHAWIVVLVAILCVGGAYAWMRQVTPLYESIAKISIESNPMPMANGMSSGAPSGTDPAFLQQQVSLMKTTAILSAVADQDAIKNLRTFEAVSPLLYLKENLEVDIGRRDLWPTISIETPYADESALIVNAVATAYREYVTGQRGKINQSVLEANSKKFEAVAAEIKEKRDRYNLIKKQNPGMAANNGESVEGRRFSYLANEITSREIELMQIETTLGLSNPRVVGLKNTIEEFHKRKDEEFERLRKLNDISIEAENLKADIDSRQRMLDQLEPRLRELETQMDVMKANLTVTVVEPGHVDNKPSFPRKIHTMIAAAIIGLVLGCSLALLRDKMDTRMHRIEDIQSIVGLPILGVVPKMPGRRSAIARAMAVHLDSRSPIAEAYRTIRTAVYFGPASSRTKTILITSPESGDGKTTSASNLAIAIAQTGRSILLLDADFRKPTQHKNLDIKDNVGLSSVLAGMETLEHAIQHTGVEGLDILPCGPIPENPSEILNSREFGELIDQLAMRYDHILFDSPPTNVVTDARILAAVVDATILVLRADKTSKKSAEHARNALLNVGAHLLGAIVNGVPRGKGYEVYGGGPYYGTSGGQDGTSGAGVRPFRPTSGGNGHSTRPVAHLPRPGAPIETTD